MKTKKLNWLVIVVLIVTAALLTACGQSGSQATVNAPVATSAPQAAPTQPPAPTVTTVSPTAVPTAAPTQPAALSGTSIDMNNPVFKAYFAVYNTFPRRARAEMTDTKTKKVVTSVVIETETKDRARIDVSTQTVTQTMIVISPTIYIQQGASWLALSGAQAAPMLSTLTSADSLQQLLNGFDTLANYTINPVGPEDLNGTPTMAYESLWTLKNGSTSTGKAWIGLDGLIRRDMIETADGMSIVTVYEYDPTIKVEAPTK